MKTGIAATLMVVSFVFWAVGAANAQGVGTSEGANIAYLASTADAPSDGFAEPWIALSVVAPEVERVKAALDTFTTNFESQDVDRLKRESWPSMSPKAYRQLKNTFAVLSHITLREDCAGSPVIVIDSADWACKEKLGFEVDGESRPTQIHATQFHLTKLEGQWYVEGRTMGGR